MARRARTPEPMQAKLRPKARRKGPPYLFVLEALAAIEPEVKPMFSGFAVYHGDRLIFLLRESEKQPVDNGLWLVLAEGTDPGDKGLRRELPSLRKITITGGVIAHWLLIPADGAEFEREALHACELILRRDARLGRIPASRR